MQQRLLIISNNVLSNTNNNGKTILSYVDRLPRENVRQLYFSSENPTISGYKYFRLSDRDVLKGIFSTKRRGGIVNSLLKGDTVESHKRKRKITHNTFNRLAREVLWYKRWNSKQLDKWLDEYNPTAVFFVAGDCLFAYSIYEYVISKFKVISSLYLTDDYIMPRKYETALQKWRRKLIRNKLRKALSITDNFFTISDIMKETYLHDLGRNSEVIVNMTESLRGEKIEFKESEGCIIYAGSLYYGRDEVLGKVSEALERHNENCLEEEKAVLNIYTNITPDDLQIHRICRGKSTRYCGSLNKEELTKKLNQSKVLLFVESFEEKEIEKTKLSLSTKVPEYMSLRKPILAVGPNNIGSMLYLEDVAMCVNDENTIYEKLHNLLCNKELQDQLGRKAEQEFIKYNNKEELQKKMIRRILIK